MRVRTFLTGRGLIPFNYNLAMAGAAYGAVKRVNTELASQIHSSTGCKYFTFSLLQIPERKISPEGIYVEDGCYFLVSSPVREVISSYVEGILEKPVVRVSGVEFEVESVEVTKSPEFDGRCVFSVPFSTKFMRIQTKETYHQACLMRFEARGDRELLKLGHEAGFEEKNSMGFGIVKVVGNGSS